MKVLNFQILGKKSLQEDAFYISPDQKLFVVCDGVGGRDKGEVASNSIVKGIRDRYESSSSIDVSIEEVKSMVTDSIMNLNKMADEKPQLKGIGTTIALLFLTQSSCYTAHLGDSRVIMLENNTSAIWSTKDHSVVQELFDAGVLKSEEEMQSHPYRNRITNAIIAGEDKAVHVVFQQTPRIEDFNFVLVCSDGLLEHYTNEDLSKLLSKEDYKMEFKKLENQCYNFSRDNSTVILIKPKD